MIALPYGHFEMIRIKDRLLAVRKELLTPGIGAKRRAELLRIRDGLLGSLIALQGNREFMNSLE